MRRSIVVVALVICLAGCGNAPHTSAISPGAPHKAPALVASAGAPRCSTAVAQEHMLVRAHPTFTSVRGRPFGVASSADGRWGFVSGFGGASGAEGQIEVITNPATPQPVRAIPIPGGALGESITRDGRYLLVADESGAAVISVAAAEQGRSPAMLGNLSMPRSRGGGGAIEVAVTPDGRFAFVSFEGSGEIGVWNLASALAHGFRTPAYVGAIPTDVAPVGMAISGDGRWLYATSELAGRAVAASGGSGTLRVIDLRTAETDPAKAVVARVTAGCNPVRVAVSPDGATVWVTARESDALLAFSAAKLRSDPSHALEADVRVGEAPVGLAVVDGGRRVVVCDSNRFQQKGAHSGLSVVDTAAALAGKPALLGEIAAGGFPRDAWFDVAAHTLLVANFESGQLETVDTASLP